MIVISEVLPNPRGKDSGAEWVELGNSSAAAVSLSGWMLRDASGKRLMLRGEIASGEYRVIGGAELALSLNNADETLVLLDPEGGAADSVSWSAAPEGESFARSGQGFLWTKLLTPGAANRVENAMFEKRLLLAEGGALTDSGGVGVALGLAFALGVIAVFLARYLFRYLYAGNSA